MHMPYIPDNAHTFTHQNARKNQIYDLAAHRRKHIQDMRSGIQQPDSNTAYEQKGSIVLPELETSDDSWLNDTCVAPRHASSTSHKHVVHYEDLPTISLVALREDARPRIQERNADDPDDLDATQRLPTQLWSQVARRGAGGIRPHITKDFNDYGPISALLENKHVRSITALGPHRIYVELWKRCGVNGKTRQMQETRYRFQSEQHMMSVIETMLHAAGRTLPANWSLSDVRLPDGLLLSVSLPPAAMHGPTFTIRKPREYLLSLEDLVHQKMLDQKAADILRVHVQSCHNICICGPTGSGKTTLLNVLCTLIPDEERIVTIEEATTERELHLPQSQVVALLTQQEGDAERQTPMVLSVPITMREALSHASRMRAQRIIVSHCHGDDVAVLLRAMFDGGSGCIMTTMNAQNVQDCLSRLELHFLMHYLRGGSPSQAIPTLNALLRAQIAASLHVVVSLSAERRVVDIVDMSGWGRRV